jgi:hypothetical protein
LAAARSDRELVAERLKRWPRADHAWLIRLAERHPKEARLVYELILYLDARPA